MVALPISGIGTGIKPSRVAPRNNATPPMMPAMTISRVLRSSTEPPLFPPELAAMLFSFCRLLGPAILYTARSICTYVWLSNCLEWRGEPSVGGGPATVHEHEGARDVGAGLRGEVDDHADHLVRLGPAAEDALGGVGVVPVGGVFDLGRQAASRRCPGLWR